MSARDRWIALHLFDHRSLDDRLWRFVVPRVRTLLSSRLIDRFFFVRFHLGGPHLRLRLRCAEGEDGARLAEELRADAEQSFRGEPAAESMPEEVVRRRNLAILAADPAEREDAYFPHGTVRIQTFEPETERYGGETALGASLELFAASSIAVLRTQGGRNSTLTPAARQAKWLRLLLAQALGFAGSREELEALVGYAAEARGGPFQRAIEKADAVAAASADELRALVGGQLRLLDAASDPGASEQAMLRRASELLAASTARLEPAVRRRIALSHLHMTANRAGNSNLEECYGSRLAVKTLRELPRTGELAFLDRRIEAAPALDPETAERALRSLIDEQMVELGGGQPESTGVSLESEEGETHEELHPGL